MVMRAYRVNIMRLKNSVHEYDFDVENDFFGHYGTKLVSEGSLKVHLTLDKRETLIDATFSIAGTVKVTCDRCLETFDEPVKAIKKLVFKFGETDEELSDEIMVIQRDTEAIDFGQYMYEFILLELPMKKLHPRFRAEEDAEDNAMEGKIIYSSKTSADDPEEGGDTDPRWEILRKLK